MSSELSMEEALVAAAVLAEWAYEPVAGDSCRTPFERALRASRFALAIPEIAAALSGGGGGEKAEPMITVEHADYMLRCCEGRLRESRETVASLESRLAESQKHLADVLHAESVLEQRLDAAEKRYESDIDALRKQYARTEAMHFEEIARRTEVETKLAAAEKRIDDLLGECIEGQAECNYTAMETQEMSKKLAAAEKEKAELRGQVETWIAAHGEQWNRANKATAEAARLRAEPGVVGVLSNDEDGVPLPCPVEIRCPNCAAAEKRAEEAEAEWKSVGTKWDADRRALRAERDALKAELAEAKKDRDDYYHTSVKRGEERDALKAELARAKQTTHIIMEYMTVDGLRYTPETIRALEKSIKAMSADRAAALARVNEERAGAGLLLKRTAECIDILDRAGCGKTGKPNCLVDMVAEIVQARDALKAKLATIRAAAGAQP